MAAPYGWNHALPGQALTPKPWRRDHRIPERASPNIRNRDRRGVFRGRSAPGIQPTAGNVCRQQPARSIQSTMLGSWEAFFKQRLRLMVETLWNEKLLDLGAGNSEVVLHTKDIGY